MSTGQDGCELLGVRAVLSSRTAPAPVPRGQHECWNPLGAIPADDLVLETEQKPSNMLVQKKL